jgi:hypothetical protein
LVVFGIVVLLIEVLKRGHRQGRIAGIRQLGWGPLLDR